MAALDVTTFDDNIKPLLADLRKRANPLLVFQLMDMLSFYVALVILIVFDTNRSIMTL
jgi:hypothetical protein